MKKLGYSITLLIIATIAYRFIPSSQKISNAVPLGTNIICFGDSLTYGTGAEKGMDYPSQLSELIDFPIINKGVPGDTTAMALNRIKDVLDNDPRIVLLVLGGNDLKNGISKETTFANLSIIIQKIQRRGALVILGGIDIPFFGRAALMSDRIHPNSTGYTIIAQYFLKAIQPYL